MKNWLRQMDMGTMVFNSLCLLLATLALSMTVLAVMGTIRIVVLMFFGI